MITSFDKLRIVFNIDQLLKRLHFNKGQLLILIIIRELKFHFLALYSIIKQVTYLNNSPLFKTNG